MAGSSALGSTAILAKIVLSLVFVYAGFLKVQDPQNFLIQLRAYDLLGDPWAALMALFLPWLEIFAGAALFVRRLVLGAGLMIAAMLLMFLGGLASAWARGLNIACGCFGSDEPANYPLDVAKDVVLLGVVCVVLFHEYSRTRCGGEHSRRPSSGQHGPRKNGSNLESSGN